MHPYPREGRIAVAGGTIAYTVAGTGPALLLVHGLGGTRGSWRHTIDSLADTHTVIAVDLPGHGQSDPPPGDYSLGAHASALRDALVALGHSRASIVGHSLGGGVALQFAYQFPERTDRVLLISSGGLGSEVAPALRAATVPGARSIVAGISQVPEPVTRAVLRLLPAFAAREDAAPVAATLHGLSGASQRRAFVQTARTVLDWRGQTVSALRHLALLGDVPTLVAWGTKDKIIPPAHHRELADLLPEAVMVEIDGAGHFPHETHPAALVPAVQRFLTATEPHRYTETRWRDLVAAMPGTVREPDASWPNNR